MSSPKVITYTMNAFEGKLRELMRMQSRLKQMSIEIQLAAIHDNALNIHYDCSKSYQAIAAEVEKALTTLVFDYKGSFNQRTHDLIEKKINERSLKLSELIKKSDVIITDFENKQKDYKSFIDYNSFIENSKTSLEKFKKDLNEQVDGSFAKSNAVLADDAKKKFGTILYEQEKTNFDWGFNNKADEEKNKIVNHITEKENLLREIRQELLTKVVSTDKNQHISTDLLKLRNKIPDEILKVSQKIELLINNCDESPIRTNYRVQFDKLKQSESMTDLYFYQELHDRILKNETTRKHKVFLNCVIADLNNFPPTTALLKDKNFIIQKTLKLLDDTSITENEVDCIKNDLESFYRKNRQAAEEAETKKKEQHFIKTQVIHNLENLGYEVMEDLNVIDFEKENDFYLKAPGQENLLNLKFKEDGSFRYVFEIPEKVDQLTVDQQKMRLHEMKTTCHDFLSVVDDLKQMGVKMDIKAEKPEELSSLVTIPESVSAKLNTRKDQPQRKQQIKKLYLD
jgi:hypothetical protein